MGLLGLCFTAEANSASDWLCRGKYSTTFSVQHLFSYIDILVENLVDIGLIYELLLPVICIDDPIISYG